MRQMTILAMASCISLISHSVVGEEPPSSAAVSHGAATSPACKPAPDPSTQPVRNEGEKPYEGYYQRAIPGSRHWVFWRDGDIKLFNTTESAGDGSAIKLYLPAGSTKAGYMIAYDIGVQPVKKGDVVVGDDFKDYKGICLWMKGDGSDGAAVFSTSYATANSPRFRVPLKDDKWHKVFLSWDKWEPAIKGHFYFLAYSIERKDNSKPSYFIVDNVSLYKDEKVEEIKPTANIDPPGYVPAQQFVTGKEHIAKTLAKLKAGKPVKIVVAGDSIVAGAQMGYIRKSYSQPNEATYPYLYWALLAGRLQKEYGYKTAGWVLRTHDDKKKWYDTFTPRPAGDLQVVAVARGGWESWQGLAHIDQILAEKPDLVIWEYGANEGINGHMNDRKNLPNTPGYVTATTRTVEKLKEAGIEVVLQTVTTMATLDKPGWLGGLSQPDYTGKMSEQTRKIAQEKGCGLADIHQAMRCRGIQFVGALHGDFVHLNHYGYELFADVLEAMLTDRDVRTWRHVPADLVPAGMDTTPPATAPSTAPSAGPSATTAAVQ